MASFDLKVEDSSPLFSYAPDGAWADSPSSDALVASYSGRSLHTSSAQGATATINFNGTGITIFGGKRSNYGTFAISVDGQTVATGDANSAQNSTNQVLGSASNLVDGTHTAVLTNTGGSFIDIDFVNVETQPSLSSSAAVISTTIDDTDPRIQYLPSTSAWNLTQNPDYINGTLHFTSTIDASASISFTGDAVAVYGTMAPDRTDVQMTLDGRSSASTGGGGGFVSMLHTQVLLYYANNLGPDTHLLSMTSLGNGGGPFMDIDAITVFSSGAPSTSNSDPESPGTGNGSAAGSSSASSNQPSSSSSSKSRLAPILGSVAGGVVVLLLLGVSLFLSRRRRNRPGLDKRDIRLPTSPKTPDLPMQGENMMEAGFSQTVVQSPRIIPAPRFPAPTYMPSPPPPLRSAVVSAKRETMHSIAPSYYSDPSYTSEMSSPQSSIGLLPPVPTSPPSALLIGSPRYGQPKVLDPMMMGSPRRPNRRPPPLDIE